MTTQSITFADGRVLARLLSDVEPFAAHDDTLPTLSTVRLDAARGTITAQACDRYAVAQSRVSEVEGEFTAVAVTVADALKIIKATKGTRNSTAPVTLTVTDGGVFPEPVRTLTVATPGAMLTFGVVDGVTDWVEKVARVVLSEKDKLKADHPILLDARILAKFAKVAGTQSSGLMRMYFYGHGKAAQVQIGEHFRAAVMSIRLRGEEIDDKPDPASDTPSVPWGLPEAPEPPAAECGAAADGGPCVLPAGHNMGKADVPENHSARTVKVPA